MIYLTHENLSLIGLSSVTGHHFLRRQQEFLRIWFANMQMTDWSDLQVFLAIARAGQLAKAGATIGVNGATVGRRLRRLEAELGTSLFEQTREGQQLTEAGEALLAKVEMMASAADMISQQKSLGRGPTGTLRLSVSEGFGSWFLTRHIPDFVGRYPDLHLDLVASSGFLSPSKREADIAVVLSRPKAGHVIAQKLATYKLQLYASSDYLVKNGMPAKLGDLGAQYRLIGYIPDLLYAPELNYLDDIVPGLQPDIRSSSIIAQHRLISVGAGIGVLPCFIGDSDKSLSAIFPETFISRNFWLVTHKDTRSLERIKAGKQWLLDVVAADREVLAPANRR